jgi:hypothetical protein
VVADAAGDVVADAAGLSLADADGSALGAAAAVETAGDAAGDGAGEKACGGAWLAGVALADGPHPARSARSATRASGPRARARRPLRRARGAAAPFVARVPDMVRV